MAGDITESKEYQQVSRKIGELGVDDPDRIHQMTLDIMDVPQDDRSRFQDVANKIFDLLEPFDHPRRGVEKAGEKVGPALLEAADYPRRELSKEWGKLMKRAGVSPHSSSTGKVPRTVTEELSEQELQLKKILEGETATEKE